MSEMFLESVSLFPILDKVYALQYLYIISNSKCTILIL